MKNKHNYWTNKQYKYQPISNQSPKQLSNETKQTYNQLPNETKKTILRRTIPLNATANVFKPNNLFNLNQSSNIIQLDMIKDNSNKQLEDIFKVLLNYGSDSNIDKNKDKSKCNLQIKEFDLNKEYVELNLDIKTLDDLIKMSEIKLDPTLNYTIDIQKIINMKEVLIELNNMIGMESVKKSIVKQIMYFLQGIEIQQDMLHMIITGSPGTGKTSLGIILAKLYYQMGIIESKPSINPLTGQKENFNFKIYKRSDLIAQYLGHTAIKTQKAIDECIGGVMFLDEAYSLGHDDKSDIYTKECLDTLNQNLSENKNKFILIIAGYPDQLDKCFFSHNEGLRRRFSFKYHIEKYNSIELMKILYYKINSQKWILDSLIKDEQIIQLIDNSIELFDNFGGDIETWLLHIKIEHGTRIFGKHPKYRKIIMMIDLKKGLTEFSNAKNNNQKTKEKENQKQIMQYMYC